MPVSGGHNRGLQFPQGTPRSATGHSVPGGQPARLSRTPGANSTAFPLCSSESRALGPAAAGHQPEGLPPPPLRSAPNAATRPQPLRMRRSGSARPAGGGGEEAHPAPPMRRWRPRAHAQRAVLPRAPPSPPRAALGRSVSGAAAVTCAIGAGLSGGRAGGRWEMAEYLASIFGTEKDK